MSKFASLIEETAFMIHQMVYISALEFDQQSHQ